MATIDTHDHTIGFNLGGTWADLDGIAHLFGADVKEVEAAVDAMKLDWIGDDLTDRAQALICEELVDVFGRYPR